MAENVRRIFVEDLFFPNNFITIFDFIDKLYTVLVVVVDYNVVVVVPTSVDAFFSNCMLLVDVIFLKHHVKSLSKDMRQT